MSEETEVYKTSEELRRENAQTIIENLPGGATEAQDTLGRAQAQVSATMGPSASKAIGQKLARAIEETFDKPYGWLDNAHSEFASKARVDYLVTAIVKVEEAVALSGKPISPQDKAGAIVAVYDGLVAGGSTQEVFSAISSAKSAPT